MPIFLHENRQHDAIQAKLNFIIERREGGSFENEYWKWNIHPCSFMWLLIINHGKVTKNVDRNPEMMMLLNEIPHEQRNNLQA